jgi:hypothetical protein
MEDIQDKLDQYYVQGQRRAFLSVLQTCMRELGQEDREKAVLVSEREEAISMLRMVCEEFGDNDWPDNLHLVDIIEKHLYRNLVDRDRETEEKPEALCRIFGSEINFERTCKPSELRELAEDIWTHPSKYSSYEDGTAKAFYSFIKLLWIRWPDSEIEQRLVDYVDSAKEVTNAEA